MFLFKRCPLYCMWGATTDSAGDRNHKQGLLRRKTRQLYSLHRSRQPPASHHHYPCDVFICLFKGKISFPVLPIRCQVHQLLLIAIFSCEFIPQRAACTSLRDFCPSQTLPPSPGTAILFTSSPSFPLTTSFARLNELRTLF